MENWNFFQRDPTETKREEETEVVASMLVFENWGYFRKKKNDVLRISF